MEEEIEKNKNTKTSLKAKEKQNSPEPTVESIDKAFEWLVLVQTILVSVIFQVLTWTMRP